MANVVKFELETKHFLSENVGLANFFLKKGTKKGTKVFWGFKKGTKVFKVLKKGTKVFKGTT